MTRYGNESNNKKAPRNLEGTEKVFQF